ncbi:MAG: hypothetical protein ACI8XV_000883, partial [Arenicella sp.]
FNRPSAPYSFEPVEGIGLDMSISEEQISIWICKESGCPFTGCCVDNLPRDGINRINEAMRSEQGLRCPRCSRHMEEKSIDFHRYEFAERLQPYRWLVASVYCAVVAFPVYLLAKTNPSNMTNYFLIALVCMALFICSNAGILWMFKNDPNEIPDRLDNLFWVRKFLQGSIVVFFLAIAVALQKL